MPPEAQAGFGAETGVLAADAINGATVKLVDFEGHHVRLRKTTTTKAGDVFPAGTRMVVHSIHRGRLALQNTSGRFLRQVNRYDVILTRGNPDVLEEWAGCSEQDRDAVIASLEGRESETCTRSRVRLIAAAVLRGDLETTKEKPVKKPQQPRSKTP